MRAAGAARRASAAALVQTVVGPGAGGVDPVVAVMVVVAEGRAALWLARQERLAGVGAERWVELGCRNVACALRTLAGAAVAASG